MSDTVRMLRHFRDVPECLWRWPNFSPAERAGRAAERLETLERSDAIHRQMLDAAAHRPRSRDDLLDRLRGGGG